MINNVFLLILINQYLWCTGYLEQNNYKYTKTNSNDLQNNYVITMNLSFKIAQTFGSVFSFFYCWAVADVNFCLISCSRWSFAFLSNPWWSIFLCHDVTGSHSGSSQMDNWAASTFAPPCSHPPTTMTLPGSASQSTPEKHKVNPHWVKKILDSVLFFLSSEFLCILVLFWIQIPQQ